MAETPQRNRKNTWLIVVIVGAILLLLLCACLAVVLAASWFSVTFPWQRSEISGITIDRIGDQMEMQRAREEAFNVSTPVLLDITNKVGDIHIIGTDEERVSVQAVMRGYGDTRAVAEEMVNKVTAEIQQTEDNQIRLVGSIPHGPRVGNSPEVDWTVRVPRQVQLQIRNNVGEVRIENVAGSIQVTGDVGDISVKGFTLTADSQLTANVGDISISLPRDSEFTLDATTGVGNVRSEFHTAAEPGDRRAPGSALKGTVGDNPQSTLKVQADVGDITIEQE